MINLKTFSQIEQMKKAGAILRDLLLYLEDMVKPGVSTNKLNDFSYDYIKKHNCIPSFLGYGGFPASICASVDEVVVHGIPSARKLIEGEIIGIDVGVILNGWHSDAARTFAVGEISQEKQSLIDVTKQSFFEGVKFFTKGGKLGDISHAIQEYTEAKGYSVVRAMVGHGIGNHLHEDPSVPNYGKPNRGVTLQNGLVLAIEPMINIGTYEVDILSDGWTCVTRDRKPSAHYENTVALTENGIEILTL